MKPSWTFYRVIRAIVVGFCRTYWKVTYEGLENVPKDGPFILAPSHRAYQDTPMVAPVTPRHLRYMAGAGIFKYKLSAMFFQAMGTFPVHRGKVDRETLRTCQELLSNGEAVVIFPEGTRKRGPEIKDLFEGVAYVASRTGAPIVPIGIGGGERGWPKGKKLPRPGRIHVLVGEPLYCEQSGARVSRAEVRELNERLHAALQDLFDRAQAKVGA